MKIIKVSAMWCPSCLIMNDLLDEVLESYTHIKYEKLDFDLDADIVEKFNVGNILPVLIKFDDDDHELSRLIGEKSKEEIIEFIEGR